MSSSQSEEGNNGSSLVVHAPPFINMYSGLPGKVKYMDCLKNHAASIGGNATDGCQEFMAGGEPGTLEALKCCACNCHRNFHRRLHMQHEGEQPSLINVNNTAALAGASASIWGHQSGTLGVGKKMLRTKFSQEQKERMYAFAERCGWKLRRVDDSAVRSFCQEIGIKRKALKIWIHNNKYHLANKHNTTTTTTA